MTQSTARISQAGLRILPHEGKTDELFKCCVKCPDWGLWGEWPDYSSVKGRHRTTGREGATSHHKPMTLTYQEPLSVKMILGAAGSQTVQEWCHCTTDCLHFSLLLWTSFWIIQFLLTGRICNTSNLIVRLESCGAAGFRPNHINIFICLSSQR